MRLHARLLGFAIASMLAAASAVAAAPAPYEVTPELVQKATAEGKVVFYTSVELDLIENLAKIFRDKYPGINVQVERTGSERVYQRIGQEYSANIHTVDVVNSSDAAHFIFWKKHGMLAPAVSAEMAEAYPASAMDPDGAYASWRVTLSPLAYNTDLSEDKQAAFRARRDVGRALPALTVLVSELELDRERLAAAVADPLLAATDVAEQLVREGVPFRDAHERVARSVRDGTFEAPAERPPRAAPGPGGVCAAIAAARERLAR